MTSPPVIVAGVSWWNRPTLNALLGARGDGEGVRVIHLDAVAEGIAAAARESAPLYAWASKVRSEDEAAARAAGVAMTFVEDGFIRSVGLGAGLARGGSFVLDRSGIYYDATRPSDIETMLETADLGAEEIARAGALRAAMTTAGITKYNVGRRARLEVPAGRERVLVVGQVAVDAGVRRTLSPVVDVTDSANVNRDLLIAARAAFPGAFIVYKPHPDVAGGLRPGAVSPEDAARYADRAVADADIAGLMETCDRVMTLSSLSGFEALLRGKAVTCLGLPFYAGWGLTDDRASSPRRSRRRTLEELVAVTLLRYCRYVDPVTCTPCPPENMIARLAQQRASMTHHIAARARQHASWLGRKLGL